MRRSFMPPVYWSSKNVFHFYTTWIIERDRASCDSIFHNQQMPRMLYHLSVLSEVQGDAASQASTVHVVLSRLAEGKQTAEKSKKTMKRLTKPNAGVCEVRWSLWRDILAEAATTWFSCSCWCEAGKGYLEVRRQKRGFCSYLNVSATWTANDVQNSSFVKDWKVTLDSYQAGYIFVVVKKKKENMESKSVGRMLL